MGYEPSDSSGTDDDFPPMNHNRGARGGQLTGNGAAGLSGLPYTNVNDDMETQIYILEQEAYRSVLRAFKAQSDALTWEKESLITDLRKELRVSDQEHRELLASVNADDVILRIREWRQAGGVRSSLPNNTQAVLKKVSSPTVSVTHKKQKLPQSLPIGGGAPALNTQVGAAPLQPSSSTMKRGAPPSGTREKKPKLGQNLPRVSSMKSVQYSLTGASELGHITNRGSSGALAKTEPAKDAGFDLIGRTIMTRWPADNTFYKAVINDYDPVKGVHSLAYDVGTDQETYEWVNLKEISPDDIRWDGEDPGTSFLTSHGGSGRGSKMPYRQGVLPDIGKGRGTMKNQSKKDFPQAKKTIPKKSYDDIRILDTDALIKQVERVFSSNIPDPLEVDKAKELLKAQERSLVDALNRLADASDGESEKNEYKVSHGHGIDQETGRKKRPHPRNQNESRW